MDEVTIPKCDACRGVFDPERPEDLFLQRDQDGNVRYRMHITCAMRDEIEQKSALLNNLTAIFLGVLSKLGGTTRVTQADIDAGIGLGNGNVNVKQEKSALTGQMGDFVVSAGMPDDRRIIPASAVPSHLKLIKN